MADVVGTGKAVLTADTSQHDAALAKSAKVAATEAAKASAAQIREANRAATASTTAAKGIGAAFAAAGKSIQQNQMVSQLETISALFIQVGGNVSRAASVVTSLIRPVATASTVLSSMGVDALAVGAALGGVAASAAGVYLATRAVSGLASSAAEAGTELEKMGFHLGPEAEKNLALYAEGQDHLTVAVDKAKVALGSDLAGALGVLSQAFATDIQWLTQYALKLGNAAGSATLLESITDKLAKRVGIDPVLTRNKAQYVDMVNEQIKLEPKLAKELEDSTKRLVDRTKAEQKGVDIAHDREIAAGEATRSAISMAQTEQASLGTMSDQILDQYRLREEAIDKLAASGAAASEIANLRYQSEQVALRALHDDEEERYRANREGERALADTITHTRVAAKSAEVAIGAMYKQMQKDTRAYYRVRAEAEATSVANITGNLASVAQSVADSYQARIDAGEHLSQKETQAANAAMQEAEALMIGQAGIQAAVTFSSGLASLQSIGVPPPVAIPLAAVESASAFAATVAGVRAHRPASFSWHGNTSNGSQGTGGAGTDPTTGEGIGKGNADTSSASDSGASFGGKGQSGTQSRSSGGATLDLSPDASRLLRQLRRAGKRDHRGGR